MKKITLLFIFSLFLFACSQDGEDHTACEDQMDQVQEESSEEGELEKEEVQLPVEDEEFLPQQPLYKIDEATWSVVPISEANEKVVLLTFDDAPDKYAVNIAHTLKELGVKAIFFVNGHFINNEEGAKKLKEIYELGFPIGNHTYSHQNLKQLSVDEQYKEIISLNDRVEEIIGERPKFFRAPFGVNTEDSKRIVTEEKMVLMNWTYGYDWEKDYQGKDALADIMVNSPYLRNGANLLMHDRLWTSEAIKEIVLGLQEKGYEMVDPALIQVPEN